MNEARDLCYILYTSGSTGQPKGVMTTHQNVVRTVINNGYLEVTPEDRVLQLSNYAFDGSTFDIYGALLSGATLVLISRDTVSDGLGLSRVLKEERITVSFMTTALFNTLVDVDGQALIGLRKVLFGGEAVSVPHVRKAVRLLGADRILHVYGPTETTVFATFHPVDRRAEGQRTIPIGKPLSNTTCYVLDRQGRPQPIGVPGEL
ncbi:AMP-binding protein, partial [Kroppenstedtia guangzhouensis]|uniref:AMP-binding protein n=1 Tax=Kroppenstedtia guangzhouensis TaxID=1274356 RepID=UPI001E51DF4E